MDLPIIANNSILSNSTVNTLSPTDISAMQLPLSPLLPKINEFKPINIFSDDILAIPDNDCIYEKAFNLPVIESQVLKISMLVNKAINRKNPNGKKLNYTDDQLILFQDCLTNQEAFNRIIDNNLLDIKDENGNYKYNITEIAAILVLKKAVFEIFKERILSQEPINTHEIFSMGLYFAGNFDIQPMYPSPESVLNYSKVKEELNDINKKTLSIIKRDLINLKRIDGEYVFSSKFKNFFLFYSNLMLTGHENLAKDILTRITDDLDFDFETRLYDSNLSFEKTAAYKKNIENRNLFLEKNTDGEYKYQSKQIKEAALLSDKDFDRLKYFEDYDFNGEKWAEPIGPYITLELIKLSDDNIEFLRENKILDAFKNNKIFQNTFRDICHTLNNDSKLSETISEDIKLLKEGKTSSVIEFDEAVSKEEDLKNTKQADVIKIGEKMYINDRNSLIEFNISKEKFDELFSLVNKFATAQGESGDCYFVAALIGLMNNPLTRPYIYSSFNEIGRDILCTIRSYKNYKGTTIFKGGKVTPADRSLYGARAMQMFEQAYALTSFREDDDNLSDNLNGLLKRIEGGCPSDALSEITGIDFTKVLTEKEFKKSGFLKNKNLKHSAIAVTLNNKKIIENYLTEYGNDKNVINIIYWSDIEDLPKIKQEMWSNHCYVLDSYDPEKKTIKVISAWEAAEVFEIPIKSLKNVNFSIGNFYPKN